MRTCPLALLLAACQPDPEPVVAPEPVPCPAFEAGQSTGTVASASITEASGLAASRRTPDVLFVHNDSGDGARVYAIGADGSDRGAWSLDGESARDWEDMAAGPGPDGSSAWLYLGDIGDNGLIREDLLVHRVAEPSIGDVPAEGTFTEIDTFVLAYPDGPHDAETLLVDPISGDLFVLTKDVSGESGLYRTAAPLADGEARVMEQVATLWFGSDELPGATLTTAGDVSPLGDLIVLKTYTSAFVFRRDVTRPLHEAFDSEPCPVDIVVEAQGEAIAFAAEGGALHTVSEGEHPDVWTYRPR